MSLQIAFPAIVAVPRPPIRHLALASRVSSSPIVSQIAHLLLRGRQIFSPESRMVTTRLACKAGRSKAPRKIVTATNALRYSKSRMSYKREPSPGLANVQLVAVGGSAVRQEAKLRASLEAQTARKKVEVRLHSNAAARPTASTATQSLTQHTTQASCSASPAPPMSEQSVRNDEDDFELQRKRELFSPVLEKPLFLAKLAAITDAVAYWEQPVKEHAVGPFESKLEEEEEDGASLQPSPSHAAGARADTALDKTTVKPFAKLQAVKAECLPPPSPSARTSLHDSPTAYNPSDCSPTPAPALSLKPLPTHIKHEYVVESSLLDVDSIDELAQYLGGPFKRFDDPAYLPASSIAPGSATPSPSCADTASAVAPPCAAAGSCSSEPWSFFPPDGYEAYWARRAAQYS